MCNLTETQQIVVDAKIKDGYEVIGKFRNIDGIGTIDIGLVKGRHRVHINCLGYDSYIRGVVYQEVK